MEKDNKSFVSLVISTSLLGNSILTPLERLLLIYILSLCKKYGYCWATNEHFKKIFSVSKQTISKSISSLSKYGYIALEYDKKEKNNSKRLIRISEVLKKEISDIKDNLNTSIQKNFKQNNKYSNNKEDIGSIIEYDSKGNIKSWNGKEIKSEPMDEESLKELNELLNDITQGDDN